MILIPSWKFQISGPLLNLSHILQEDLFNQSVSFMISILSIIVLKIPIELEYVIISCLLCLHAYIIHFPKNHALNFQHSLLLDAFTYNDLFFFLFSTLFSRFLSSPFSILHTYHIKHHFLDYKNNRQRTIVPSQKSNGEQMINIFTTMFTHATPIH